MQARGMLQWGPRPPSAATPPARTAALGGSRGRRLGARPGSRGGRARRFGPRRGGGFGGHPRSHGLAAAAPAARGGGGGGAGARAAGASAEAAWRRVTYRPGRGAVAESSGRAARCVCSAMIALFR